MRGKNLLILMLCLVFLAACGGGGGGGGGVSTPDIPRSDPLPIISANTNSGATEGESLDIDILSNRDAPSTGLLVMFLINGPVDMASEFTVSGADCTLLMCSIMIRPGSDSASFMLMPIDDNRLEPGEVWTVEIIDGSGYNHNPANMDSIEFAVTDPPTAGEPDLQEDGTEELTTNTTITPTTPPPSVESFRTPEYNTQLGLAAIKADEAYARGYTGRGVAVAVLDSGIEADHPEFNSPGKIVGGYDFIDNENIPDSEGNSHGIAVAGIIAGEKEDGDTEIADRQQMHGVAYEANIIPLRILNSDGVNEEIYSDFPAAIAHARGHDAFVYNNSWGFVSRHEFTYQGVSVYVSHPTTADRTFFGGELRRQVLLAISEDDAIFVWAAGNGRWNSENAVLPIFRVSDDTCVPHPFLSLCLGLPRDELRDSSNDPDGVLPTADNQVSDFGGLPTRFPELLGHWLAVVNYVSQVDLNGVVTGTGFISEGSNGCGDAMAWCLAAPGTTIHSAADGNTYRGRNLLDGRRNIGTSFAAPHVSGAIAVLKSAFPMMTAPQIVELLLMTATDVGAVGVDPVFGHGLLNLDEATRPQGAARLASSMTRRGKKGGVMLVSDSRIESSSAFGGAFDATAAQLGAIDSFDRVFPLSLSNLADEDSDAAFPIAHSAVAQVQIFEDEKGFWSRQTADGESLAFGWRGKQGRHRFSVQAEAADDKNHLRELSEEFDAFASSNVLSSDNLASAEWRMDINDAFQTAMRFEMGDGDDSKTHRAAFRASWQASSSLQMAAEIGNYLEKGSLLGAKFRGGLKIGGGSTAYGKLSAHYQLGKWNAVASATKGITRANDLGGIVQSVTSLHSAGFHFGIERESNRGAMRFQVSRDLSVQRGALDLSYVGGYEGNDYRIDSARINLAGNPPTRFAFLFQKHLGICKLKRGAKLSVGVGAEFIANSPRRNYQDNDTILSAAFRCGF